ncbi:DUF6518 family protein [Streptomyces rhizosphaericola]|uniref:DUF6518 family protein n=1 Tax=Streptomyces rhizosphaericola TaxID=2564098 RepID=UPI00368E5F1D
MSTTRSLAHPVRPQARAAGLPAVCLGAGIALGVLTNLLQGRLPWPWSQLANSGGVWSVFAFVAGALAAGRTDRLRTAAAAGALTEIGLVVGYYGYAEFGRDGMGSLVFPLLWIAMACVAGPLFGIAGAWWRRGAQPWRRYVALGAFGGLFGSEALHSWLTLGYASQAAACAAVACGLPLLLGRTGKERAWSLAAMPVASFAAYLAVYGLLDQVSA